MRCTAAVATLTLAIVTGGQAKAQDAAAGQTVFKKCAACHVADEDKNKIGPSLKGVIGRTAGTYPNFNYSRSMKEAGEGGLVWDDANLTIYLRSPKELVKGGSMAFIGLKKDEDVANVIAYLKQFSP